MDGVINIYLTQHMIIQEQQLLTMEQLSWTATYKPDGTVLTLTGSSTNGGRMHIRGDNTQTLAGLISSANGTSMHLESPATNLIINTANNIAFAGKIVGAGYLTKAGAGSLTLSGTNAYYGGTLINAGSLILGASNVLSDHTWVQLANTNGATLDLNDNSDTIGSLLGGGTSGGNIVLGSGTLTVNQKYRFTSSGTAASENSTYAGVISGTGNFIKNNYGTLSLTGNNTYTGTTTINASEVAQGGLIITGNGNLSNSTAVTVANGAIIIFEKSVTIGSIAGAGKVDLRGVSTTLTNGDDDSSTTYSGVLSGGGVFVKNGSGTLTLSGTNTHYGKLSINEGGITLGASNVIHDNSWVSLANTSGVNLNLNGNNDTIGSLEGGGTSGGNVVLGSGNLTINQIYRFGATVADQNTTYAGVISGTGSVTKTGYGYLTLTGANTYTGGSTIKARLQIDVNNGLAANRAISITNTGILYILKNRTITTSALAISENAKLWIQSGATVNIDQASNTEMAGIIFGHGAGENKGKLRKTGSGTFNITGSNNITVENY